MSTLIMKNFDQSGVKAIVFAPNGNPRPVANIDSNNISEQCLVAGDTILSTRRNVKGISYHIHGSSEPCNETDLYEKLLNNDLYQFLKNKETTLPTFDGWDGINTINDVVFKYGLDKFLSGIPDHAILGGLMGLTGDLFKPQVGSFDVEELFKNYNFELKNGATEKQAANLFAQVDYNYHEWLLKAGINIPHDSVNWNHAKRLPEILSVSCILKDGEAVRFNDLVIFRGNDVEPEVISIFDIVTTFNMKDTNFITLPYVLSEDVTRVMYILHGDKLTDDGDNIVWLYRAR